MPRRGWRRPSLRLSSCAPRLACEKEEGDCNATELDGVVGGEQQLLQLRDGEGGGLGAQEVGAEHEEAPERVQHGPDRRGVHPVGEFPQREVELGGVLGQRARGVEER